MVIIILYKTKYKLFNRKSLYMNVNNLNKTININNSIYGKNISNIINTNTITTENTSDETYKSVENISNFNDYKLEINKYSTETYKNNFNYKLHKIMI